MSALLILKNICITNLSDKPSTYRRAVTNVFNAIQEDLQIHGYEQSSNVDDAMADLDKALIAEAESEEAVVKQEQDDRPIIIKSLKAEQQDSPDVR